MKTYAVPRPVIIGHLSAPSLFASSPIQYYTISLQKPCLTQSADGHTMGSATSTYFCSAAHLHSSEDEPLMASASPGPRSRPRGRTWGPSGLGSLERGMSAMRCPCCCIVVPNPIEALTTARRRRCCGCRVRELAVLRLGLVDQALLVLILPLRGHGLV